MNTGNDSATDIDTPGTSQIDLVVTKTDGQTDLRAGRGDHLHDRRDQRGPVLRERLHHHRHRAGGDHGRDGDLCASPARPAAARTALVGQHRQLHRRKRRPGRGQRDHDHGERHREPGRDRRPGQHGDGDGGRGLDRHERQATTARPTPTRRACPGSIWRSPRPMARRPTCPGRPSATRSPSRTRGRARRPASPSATLCRRPSPA